MYLLTTTGSFASPSPTPDKEKVVLFIGLLWCPFLPRCRRFLSLSFMTCTKWFLLQPCHFWVVCHPSRTYLPKELGLEPQNRSLPLSPPPNHTPLPLNHNSTKSHIGWVQVGGAWASRMLSLHVCPRFAHRSCVCRGLEACLHSLLLFFVLLCGLFYNSLLTLGAGTPLILGFIFLLAHFLTAIMFCHIPLSFLL